MAHNATPAILPFKSSVSLPMPIEVQRFEHGHFVDSAGLHGHQFNEVILFESAGDVHRVGGLETISNVGTVDAVGEGQIHKVALSARAGGWMLLFPDAAIQQTRLPLHVLDWFSRRENDKTGHCALSATRRKRLSLFLSTLESVQQQASDSEDLAPQEKPTLALFSAILRELSTGYDLHLPAFAAYRHFELLLETIDGCYRQRLTLDELTDTIGLSSAFLTTDLRQKTGRTAMQWVLERRMREARRLLSESDLTITQLAHDLGFEDSSHFARRFRAHHDTSPLQWRAARRFAGVKNRNFVPAAVAGEKYG